MQLHPDQRAWIDCVLKSIAAAEAGPSIEDLAEAPVLERWLPIISPHGHFMLLGLVSGHPRLRNTMIATSQLIAIDAAKGWARTASRWYRLGKHLSEFAHVTTGSASAGNSRFDMFSFEYQHFNAKDDLDRQARPLAAYFELVRGMDLKDRQIVHQPKRNH